MKVKNTITENTITELTITRLDKEKESMNLKVEIWNDPVREQIGKNKNAKT